MESKSSPEIIVASLNEQERKCSLRPRHFNCKKVYPFWKVCQNCKKPFTTNNPTQATRNVTCSKLCKNSMIGNSRRGKTIPLKMRQGRFIVCAVCSRSVWKPAAWLRKVKTPTCSRTCNGRMRGEEWKKHAHKGRRNWSPQSEIDAKIRMTGSRNPAWKGGLTYRNRKGLYALQPIKYVRCPIPYMSMSRRDGYVMEHRLVVALALKRPLLRVEVVHHIDHDATNNSVTNLMLFRTNGEHKAFENGADIKPLWCGLCRSTTQERSGVCECLPGPSSQSGTE
jgi:hypothetical protein